MAFRFTTFAVGKGGRTGFRVMASGEKLFAKLGKKAEEKIEEFRDRCNELFDRIVVRNPVADEPYYDLDAQGNKPRALRFPGRSRAGWTITFELTKSMIKCKIMNPVYYTVYLEYGHSVKAPDGMIRIALREFKERLR